MFLASQCYRFAIFLRNKLFDCNLLPIYHSKRKVVSIGNIACGGTGKTPFTALFAESIGLPVAILERGYKAKLKRNVPFIVSSPDEGDEAYLLAQKLPFAKVIVGRKRVLSAKFAETLPVNYILLDDGMQHRYLHRDLEITILHYKDVISPPKFLPAGLLRESQKRLKYSHAVIINGVSAQAEFDIARNWVRRFSNAPIIGAAYEVIHPAQIQNKKVAAFCGIGKPVEFFSLLKSHGCDLLLTKAIPDHSHFLSLNSFVQEAKQKGAELILCTEKDYIKLKNSSEIIPIQVELKIRFGLEHFENLVNKIKNPANQKET